MERWLREGREWWEVSEKREECKEKRGKNKKEKGEGQQTYEREKEKREENNIKYYSIFGRTILKIEH